MYYCYGELRSQKGGIPVGGSDQSISHLVFAAGENPVKIIAGSYRSGDANEEYNLALVPPDFVVGTVIAGGNQGTYVLNGQLLGGLYTATKLGNVFQDITTKSQAGKDWIIPPYWQVIVWPASAASAADFRVYLLGMDLVKP